MAIYLFLVDLVDCSRSSWPIQPPTRKAQEFWICSHREARRLLKELKELDDPIMLFEPKVSMTSLLTHIVTHSSRHLGPKPTSSPLNIFKSCGQLSIIPQKLDVILENKVV